MLKAGFDGDVRMLASLPYIEQVVIHKLELCGCMQGTGALKKKKNMATGKSLMGSGP